MGHSTFSSCLARYVVVEEAEWGVGLGLGLVLLEFRREGVFVGCVLGVVEGVLLRCRTCWGCASVRAQLPVSQCSCRSVGVIPHRWHLGGGGGGRLGHSLLKT